MGKALERKQESFDCTFLDSSHLPECIELISTAFGLDPGALVNWFASRIVRNPFQKELRGAGVAIRQKGELIAFRAMFGQPWWIEGHQEVVAFAAHTCVKKAFQGKGLGRLLIEKSKECAPLTGSTSSGVGTQPLYAQQGFRTCGEDNDFYRCRVSFGPSIGKRVGRRGGRLVGALLDRFLSSPNREQRLLTRFCFERVRRCDGAFDELWQRAKTGYVSCLERSRSYLNWRLFDFPTCPMQIAGIYDASGALRCFAIWHTVCFDSHIRMAVLRDLFASIDDEEAFRAMVGHLLHHWRREGNSWASFEVAHPRITALFQSMGFEHVPSIGNRYHIHTDRQLNAKIWEGWFRSGLDGDYFDLPRADFL